MSAERWGRLVADLSAAGIEARLDERPFSEIVRGRLITGVSRSLFIRTATGNVAVVDRYWSKNDAVWLGWETYAEDREGITTRTWPTSKKRSEVVVAVREAVGV